MINQFFLANHLSILGSDEKKGRTWVFFVNLLLFIWYTKVFTWANFAAIFYINAEKEVNQNMQQLHIATPIGYC